MRESACFINNVTINPEPPLIKTDLKKETVK